MPDTTHSCPECGDLQTTTWFRRHLHEKHWFTERESVRAAAENGVPLKFERTDLLRMLFELPQVCFFCGDPVETWGAIHHIDENRANNHPANLKVAHDECHLSHHSRKRPRTAEQRAKTSRALIGVAHTEERRANISAASKRSWDERRSKRYPCPNGCGRMLADTWVERHAKACQKENTHDRA